MKNSKRTRIISLILALILVVSVFPLNVISVDLTAGNDDEQAASSRGFIGDLLAGVRNWLWETDKNSREELTVKDKDVSLSGKSIRPDSVLSVKTIENPLVTRTKKSSSELPTGGHFVALYDITLQKYDGEAYQPESPVEMKIDGVAANAEHDLRVLHILEDESAIIAGIANGTAIPVDDPAFVRAFSAQAKAASNVSNRSDVVFVEILSVHNGRVAITDNKDGTVSFDFSASSFSIYAIVDVEDPGYVVRDTYYFENTDGTPFLFVNQAGYRVDNQIIKNDEYLEDVGIPEIPGGKKFSGWYIYNKSNNTYGDQITFNTLMKVGSTSDSFYVRPYFGDVTYFDFYEDCAGNVILQRKQVPVINGQSQFDISSVTNIAPTAELAFVGWAETPGVNDDNRTVLNPGVITAGAEGKKLYPVFKSAHWISFHTAPAGSGATYIAPAFVLAGQSAASSRPDDPTWTGHRFINWYTQETGGSVFNFDQVLTSDVDVYAHWDNASVGYSVVYWKQLASDSAGLSNDQKHYEYAGIDTSRSATVGTSVSPNDNDRNANNAFSGQGFSYNSNKSTSSAVVKADGSTVINVYYDRNTYTLTFRIGSGYYYITYTTVKTIKELYGHNIFDQFPIVGTNGTTYTGYQWNDTGNTYSYALASIDIMPNANVTFNGSYRGTDKLIIYYVEVIEGENAQNTVSFGGKTYKVSHTVEHDFNFLTYGEEYYPMVGFSQSRQNAEPAFGGNGRANLGRGDYYNGKRYSNINKLYYTRNSYNLLFLNSINNQQVLNPQTVQYQKSLSGYKPSETQVPQSSVPGKTFKGWFKDIACTEPFDFNNTMPAHDVIVYAGWEDQWYRVEIDPNGGQLSASESTFFWETYGSLIEEYGDITRDYVEDPTTGTFYYHYHPYSKFQEDDYNQPDYYSYWKRCAVYNEDTTTMHMVYDPATGRYVDDQLVEDTYSDLTKRYKYEKNAYALVGWFKVITGSDGIERLDTTPFHFESTPITEDIKIRAVWRKVGEYKVKYEVQGVDAHGVALDDIIATSAAPVDSNTYADNSDSAMLTGVGAPTGYVFWGWYYDGRVYNPGEVFTLDAALADENKFIHVYPVFYQNEDVPVSVTQITYDGNGGKTSLTSDAQNDVTVSSDKTRITYGALQINADQTLKDGTLFYQEGYDLIGWNTSKTGADNGVVEFEVGQTVGADNLDPSDNTLYAVWKVKVYTITIQKDVVSIDPEDHTRDYYVNPSFTPVVPEYQAEDQAFSKANAFVFENIPYGTEFSLSEITNDNYTVKYSFVLTKDADGVTVNEAIATDASGNVVSGTVNGDIVITFTNTRLTVDVDVTKTVANSVAPEDFENFDFTVSYGSGENAVSEDVSAKHNGGKSEKITVPKGASVTITEQNAAGFVVTAKIGEAGITVDEDTDSVSFAAVEDTTVDFINTRPTVNVTVSKVLADDFNDDTGRFYFNLIELNGAEETLQKYAVANDSAIFENLPYGTQFRLAEDEVSLNEKYDTPSYELVSGGGITLSEGVYTAIGDGTIVVTNTVKRIPVTITKTVIGSDSDQTANFSFSASSKIGDLDCPTYNEDGTILTEEFALNHTGEKTVIVPFGARLTVEETGGGVTGNNYVTTVNGEEGKVFVTGEIKVEGTTVDYVNTRELLVTVTKTVISGLEADHKAAYDFKYRTADADDAFGEYITGKSIYASDFDNTGRKTSIEISVLYGQSLEIVEDLDNDRISTSVGGSDLDDRSYVLTNITEDTMVEFVNKRINGDLKIAKTVKDKNNNVLNTTENYIFLVERLTGENSSTVDSTFAPLYVVIKGNGQAIVKDLEIGFYRVTEIGDWSWRYTSSDPVTCEVNGEDVTAPFTNVRNDKNWLYGESSVPNQFSGQK